MPFNVWCDGCNHLIAKGVRFNAEKKQAGNYFSTKIWSFKMRSPCCSTEIEVRTDPKSCEYIVVTGARRKVGLSSLSCCLLPAAFPSPTPHAPFMHDPDHPARAPLQYFPAGTSPSRCPLFRPTVTRPPSHPSLH